MKCVVCGIEEYPAMYPFKARLILDKTKNIPCCVGCRGSSEFMAIYKGSKVKKPYTNGINKRGVTHPLTRQDFI